MKFVFTQVLLTLFIIFTLLFFFTSMSFWVQQGFVLFSVVVLLLLLSMVWPPDSPWSPWWKTSVHLSRKVCKFAKVTKKDLVYELGSGNGTTLTIASREFGARGVGIEVDPLRVYLSRFLIWLHKAKNIVIYRKNFFEVNISDATIVYTYLVPKALDRLKAKMLKELKPGTRVVSYVYPIPYLPEVASDPDNKLFLYIIPQEKKLISRKK